MPEKSDDLPSLEALNRKIDQAKPLPENEQPTLDSSEMSKAFRFTAELSAGVIMGAMIGYGLDIWFGTLPWAMIVCLFLGMAAGMRNMMRSAMQDGGANTHE